MQTTVALKESFSTGSRAINKQVQETYPAEISQ